MARARLRIFVPAKGVEDWKGLLAEPEKHWRAGYSAERLARAWQDAQDFPGAVRQVLERSQRDALQDLELLIGLPEHQVPLRPESGRPSQTDLWVLARGRQGLVSVAVEGKVEEPFGPFVTEWLQDASPGRQTRLRALCETLGLTESRSHGLRYQLLHRTVSAIVEAQRFLAGAAVMLIHSFSAAQTGFQDYESFAEALGLEPPQPDEVADAGHRFGLQLYLAWVRGGPP